MAFAVSMIEYSMELAQLAVNDYVMVHDIGGYYFSNHFDYNSLPRVAVYSASGADNALQIDCVRPADIEEDVQNKM